MRDQGAYSDIYADIEGFVNNAMQDINTATIARVVSVDADGLLTMQPLVSAISNQGDQIDQSVIYGIHFGKWTGNSCQIDIEPVAGDVGVLIVCHHDISGSIASKEPSVKSSLRRNSYSDSLFIPLLSKTTPTVIIKMRPDAIDITAPLIRIHGNVETTGTVKNNTKNIGSTHLHDSVQSGASNTGQVV